MSFKDKKRLIISFPLEKFPGNEFQKEEWPLHITSVYWFYIPSKNIEAFITGLTDYISSIDPIATVLGEYTCLGDSMDIPVTLVKNTGILYSIHTEFLQTIKKHQGILEEPRWCGRNYIPHVTHLNEKVYKLKKLRLDSIALVEAPDDSDLRIVSKLFYL